MNIDQLRAWHMARAATYRQSADNTAKLPHANEPRQRSVIKRAHENANFHVKCVAAIDEVLEELEPVA